MNVNTKMTHEPTRNVMESDCRTGETTDRLDRNGGAGMTVLIDGLQYANWSERIFRQMREGGVDAVHVTITYHETFRETVANIARWNRWFESFPDLIFQGFTAADVQIARDTGRTAIFFGTQNPSCIEDDIGLVEVLHRLGLRRSRGP